MANWFAPTFSKVPATKRSVVSMVCHPLSCKVDNGLSSLYRLVKYKEQKAERS